MLLHTSQKFSWLMRALYIEVVLSSECPYGHLFCCVCIDILPKGKTKNGGSMCSGLNNCHALHTWEQSPRVTACIYLFILANLPKIIWLEVHTWHANNAAHVFRKTHTHTRFSKLPMNMKMEMFFSVGKIKLKYSKASHALSGALVNVSEQGGEGALLSCSSR